MVATISLVKLDDVLHVCIFRLTTVPYMVSERFSYGVDKRIIGTYLHQRSFGMCQLGNQHKIRSCFLQESTVIQQSTSSNNMYMPLRFP